MIMMAYVRYLIIDPARTLYALHLHYYSALKKSPFQQRHL